MDQSTMELKEKDKSILLVGLDIEQVLNPAQVYQELLLLQSAERGAWKVGELLSLEGPCRSQSGDLPKLIYESSSEDINQKGSKFRCRCRRLSVDEQRRYYVANRQEQSRGESLIGSNLTKLPGWQFTEPPDVQTQLGSFGQLARNKLARRLKCARKINGSLPEDLGGGGSGDGRRLARRQQLALYKLEELLREANANLGANLLALCGESSVKLADVWNLVKSLEGRLPRAFTSLDVEGTLVAFREPMIRAPTTGLPGGWFTLRRPAGNSLLATRDLGSCSSGEDSGVDLPEVCGVHSRSEGMTSFWQVEEKLRFHCNPRILAIVEFSIDLFARLLDETPLFKLMSGTSNRKIDEEAVMLGPQEFKLHACVECQNLRSGLIFKWLTGCLTLAFGSSPPAPSLPLPERVRGKGSAGTSKTELLLGRCLRNLDAQKGSGGRQTENVLLTLFSGLPADEKLERETLARVSQLMSLLLRQHFLSPALERLYGLFAEHQLIAPPETATDTDASGDNKRKRPREKADRIVRLRSCLGNKEPKLQLEVELREQDAANKLDGVADLAASRPEEDLKATLGFVVDEMARVCRRLPRLESQLNCLKDKHSELFLEVRDDELVGETKARIGRLIDSSRSLSTSGLFSLNKSSANVGDVLNRPEFGWLNSDYSRALELLNKFRQGEPPIPSEFSLFQNDTSFSNKSTELPDYNGDDRLRQLRQSCNQIEQLNWLDCRLNDGQIKRYQDFGFVLVDYEPLRDSLVRCLRRERLLLIRIELDNLLKLMERLQLQFDEIELGLDLESAIEDYMAERLQVRQQQAAAPAQAVILSATDLDLDDELDMGGLENQLGMEVDSIFVDDNYAEAQPEATLSNPITTILHENRLINAEEEDFVAALINPANSYVGNHSQQLLTSEERLRSGTTGSERELLELQQKQQRKLAPLIESQLLVEKFNYFSELLRDELKPLLRDLKLVFEGCLFLSEHVSGLDAHLDSRTSTGQNSMEILPDLSVRSREFSFILSNSLQTLVKARERLFKLNKLRSLVLSRLLLEFHQLVSSLGIQQLEKASETKTSRQLDSYQETSDFAQKLESRCEFIGRQNKLLSKEITLLQIARLAPDLRSEYPKLTLEDLQECDSLQDLEHIARLEAGAASRQAVLDKWTGLTCLLAAFWALAEEYETQQVKWLNLDTKRIKYTIIEETFSGFSARLKLLEGRLTETEVEDERFRETLKFNLKELEEKFELFQHRRLPIFKFLTNKHLTAAHWLQLGELLSGGNNSAVSEAAANSAQNCTTLAQFLELNGDVERVVDKLDTMNKQTLLEHQLTEFLLAESRQDAPEVGVGKTLYDQRFASEKIIKGSQQHQLDVSRWLEGWSETELSVAAGQFLRAKLASIPIDFELVSSQLVALHSLIKRYLELNYGAVGLMDLPVNVNEQFPGASEVVLGTGSSRLTSSALVRPSLLVESLRYFTRLFTERHRKLISKINSLELALKGTEQHLSDITELFRRIERLYASDLKEAERETELMLVKLERETVKLELERELLAAREAAALERQREALRKRDECIREISERAIPAIRAATRALDCLEEKSLRTLRCIRPKPPEPVRLVIEAVCLLRASYLQTAAGSGSAAKTMLATGGRLDNGERHFDALQGRMLEDFWPAACRQLNGTHSQRFLADLRRLAGLELAPEVMQRIRRKYLSLASFRVSSIARVSPECGHLARWLIAVDVFDRVINVVRPNYRSYLESERHLGELFAEVGKRRRQMELISAELSQMEESLEMKIGEKSSLLESLEDCRVKLAQIGGTREELQRRALAYERRLRKLFRRKQQLVDRCIVKAISVVYLDAMQPADRQTVARLVGLKRSRGEPFII